MKTAQQLDQLLRQMTLDEKIGQLVMIWSSLYRIKTEALTGPDAEYNLTPKDVKAIGCVLTSGNAARCIQLQTEHLEEDRNQIPLIFMADVIHGFKTIYPVPLAMGASFDPALMEECAKMAAREATAAGLHLTFAPMVDYVRDARWGRVVETCGEDPLLNSIMGATQVKAFQGEDLTGPEALATCVKHFAAYGGAEAGRDYNTVELSERILREYYLPAYKACIDAGTTMLMPSFNSLNGIPSVANQWLLRDLLRDEWGFDGVIISDDSAVEELVAHGIAKDRKDAAKLAFDANCTIGMRSTSYWNHLKELVEEGSVSEAEIDAATLRVLNLKNELGLFDNPYHGASVERSNALNLCAEHRAIARHAAEECAVLLKNDGILPLSETVETVALIGPFAKETMLNGAWAGLGDCISVEEGVRSLLGKANVIAVEGCSARLDSPAPEGFESALRAAKEADVVVLCLGEPQDYTGESYSRADLTLPGAQLELAKQVIAVNPNAVALVFNGRPVILTELEAMVPALLEMWFPGSEGGAAAANLLFGRANPSGKVSMSFPKAVGQCPIYYNHPSTGRPKLTAENEFQHCASNYLDCGNLPLYSFGHGLSYSNFVYESLTLDKTSLTAHGEITVSVTLRNDSPVAGKEVVQLYLQDLVASTVRPVQSLIAFEKVFLGPGETKTVSFRITEPMLRFYDFNCIFRSEPGEFKVSTGYADHLILTEGFTLI